MTLYTLADYVTYGTNAWWSIHAWVSNSSTYELLSRWIFYASDVYTLNSIALTDPARAQEIASSKTCLTTLIGHNVNLLGDEPLNSTTFLHQQQTIIPRWRRVALAFQRMNFGLREYKYSPTKNDPNYRPGPNPSRAIYEATDILRIGDHELHRNYMPTPVLALLLPIFRYLPNSLVLAHFSIFYFLTF